MPYARLDILERRIHKMEQKLDGVIQLIDELKESIRSDIEKWICAAVSLNRMHR